MNYTISQGLMKENSLSAQIYFLLLKRARSASELSQVIYGDSKVQLSNICKALEKLSEAGFIEEQLMSNMEKEKKGIDKRSKIYHSTYKPILDYVSAAVKERKETSPSSKKKDFSDDDRAVLNLVLTSKWFSKFYSDAFLSSQDGEVSKTKSGEYYSPCPIRFFALMLEELFTISMVLALMSKNRCKNEDVLWAADFDKHIESCKAEISPKVMEKVKQTTARAIYTLGSYKQTRLAMNTYTSDLGILCLPWLLAHQAQNVGRIPLTVFVHYLNAVQSISGRKLIVDNL